MHANFDIDRKVLEEVAGQLGASFPLGGMQVARTKDTCLICRCSVENDHT